MSRASLKIVKQVSLEKKPAIRYARVSGKRQASKKDGGSVDTFTDDRHSLDTQLEACTNYAQELGYPVSEDAIFKEVYSGFELFDQPKLNTVRDLIRSGKYGALICHAIDRLVRKSSHLEILLEECERNGVELIFVLDKIEDTAIGRFTMQARAFAAEYEREKIKERTMRGKFAKVKEGHKYCTGSNVYGYNIDEQQRRQIHEQEAAVIREVFNLYVTKRYGVEKIADMINARGIKSPVSKLQPDKESKWCGSTVHRILKRADYKGHVEIFRTLTTVEHRAGKRVKVTTERDVSERVRMPEHLSPAIVTEELWERAQEIMRSNGGEAYRNKSRPALLRGLIHCAKCSHRMNVAADHSKTSIIQKYSIYRCMTSRRPSRGIKCGGSVKLEQADNYVWSKVVEHMNNPEIIIKALKDELEAPVNVRLTEELDIIETQIKKSEQTQQRLLRLLTTTEDDFLLTSIERDLASESKKRSELVERHEIIKGRMKTAEVRRTNIQFVMKFCQRFSNELATATGFEQKRKLLEILGVKVKYTDKKYQISWRFDPSRNSFLTEDVELQPVPASHGS